MSKFSFVDDKVSLDGNPVLSIDEVPVLKDIAKKDASIWIEFASLYVRTNHVLPDSFKELKLRTRLQGNAGLEYKTAIERNSNSDRTEVVWKNVWKHMTLAHSNYSKKEREKERARIAVEKKFILVFTVSIAATVIFGILWTLWIVLTEESRLSNEL